MVDFKKNFWNIEKAKKKVYIVESIVKGIKQQPFKIQNIFQVEKFFFFCKKKELIIINILDNPLGGVSAHML